MFQRIQLVHDPHRVNTITECGLCDGLRRSMWMHRHASLARRMGFKLKYERNQIDYGYGPENIRRRLDYANVIY